MLNEAIKMLDDMMAQWQQEESIIKAYQFLDIAAQCGSLEGFPSYNPENLTFILANTEHREYQGVRYRFRSALAALSFSVDEIRYPGKQRFIEDAEADPDVEWLSTHGFDIILNYKTDNSLDILMHIVMCNAYKKPPCLYPYHFIIESMTSTKC